LLWPVAVLKWWLFSGCVNQRRDTMRSHRTRVGRRRRTATPDIRRIRSIGVEEELLLVDAQTLKLVPVAAEMLAGPAGSWRDGGAVLEFEVKSEQIEVVSPPRLTLDELAATIAAGRRLADEAAQRIGARAVALATAPLPCRPHTVGAPRYDRMKERFRLLLDEQLTCGFHVHVAIDSVDEGVGVLDRIRPWLPVLLALSANSPFWQGADTGFDSYRYQAWGRWPTAGPYDRFGSPAGYDSAVVAAVDADVSLDVAMTYFDARLSAHAPTVEVRIADVCLRAEDAATIAALVRALVETAAAQWAAGLDADDVPTAMLRLASWRASRFGVSDNLVHPASRQQCAAGDAVVALLEHVDGGFASDLERARVQDGVAAILHRGNGATAQRAALELRGDCRDVVAAAIAATHSDVSDGVAHRGDVLPVG
jgi:glutamate---cysteine ligase / carboxylate-amine ligase